MSRERLAAAYDALAEAYAQVAHELRGTVQPVAGASAPQAPAPAPTQAAGRSLPPSRPPAAADTAFTECPAHRKPWKDGRFGQYCTSQSDDPEWSNDKGYCSVTPRSAGAWLRKHPQGSPTPARADNVHPQDVDDIPF